MTDHIPMLRAGTAEATPAVVERTSYPVVDGREIGWISAADMIEVDRVMIDDLRIELLQMMENAGRNLARLVLDLAAPSTVAVAAGAGGNGGGGLVAARHLTNAGVEVIVTMTHPASELTGMPAHQFDILQRMGISSSPTLARADVAIDAFIGYSLGALPKLGLRNSPHMGPLYLADISVPRTVTGPLGPPHRTSRRDRSSRSFEVGARGVPSRRISSRQSARGVAIMRRVSSSSASRCSSLVGVSGLIAGVG